MSAHRRSAVTGEETNGYGPRTGKNGLDVPGTRSKHGHDQEILVMNDLNGNKPAAIYLRRSTDKQQSLGDQRAENCRFAEAGDMRAAALFLEAAGVLRGGGARSTLRGEYVCTCMAVHDRPAPSRRGVMQR